MTLSFQMMGIAAISLLFLAAWALARKWNNYSIVDSLWAYAIGLLGIGWLTAGGHGFPQHGLLAGLLGLWSLRLGSHLQRRIRRAHPEEDSRYLKLREIWKGRVPQAFFWYFQGQALSVVILALPFLMIASGSDSTWKVWHTVGLAVVVTGILGEAIADAQMSGFKSRKPAESAVCQEGLWKYSRHPNYFFESVIWVGFYLFACGSPWGWTMIHAPSIIIFLLLKVTGIPPSEASAVRRKGDAYRRYQQTTSAFIPWPPRALTHHFPS